MLTRRRMWLVFGLTVILVVTFAAYLLHQVSMRREAAIDSSIPNGPLTISVGYGGGRAPRGDWAFQIDPAGNATLKINLFSAPKTRQFVVSQVQLDELRQALQREHFFDLDASYGTIVDDGTTTTLEISAGHLTKNVQLDFLRDWSPQRLREPSRALRVLQVILTWVNDPEVVEVRRYNQTLLDRAKLAS
jgi:hypothetical protein